MYKISKNEAQEIRTEMKKTKNRNAYRRMLAVALRGEGKKSSEIAEVTGFHAQWVGQLCKTFHKEGIEGLIEDGRKGGNHRNMSDEQVESFIEEFTEKAVKGQVVTIKAIAEAYDQKVGKVHKSKSTVYYLLNKLKWRKVVPKKFHPGKASEEEIESSKKLTLS